MKCELPANILLVGATKSGKSYYCKNTLIPSLQGQYDILVIACPNMINGDFDHLVSDDRTIFKVEKGIPSAIKELISSQERHYEMFKAGVIKRKQIPRVLVVLDDCMGNSLFRGEMSVMAKFAIRSRHLKMSFIIMAQRLRGIPRQVRLNCGYCMIFSVMNYSEVEQVIEEYCPKKYKTMMREKALEIYQTDYNFLAFNNFERNPTKRIWLNGRDLIDFSQKTYQMK